MITIKGGSKSAFTLVEIGMCLLIISILIMLCIPIIARQVKKTDEYSYYLAYKTVEKMGSQIVAFGDPGGEINISYNNPANSKFALGDKIFKILNPKALAYSHTSEIVSFPSYEYDFVRVCLGNPNVIKNYDVQAGNESWTYNDLIARNQTGFCATVTKNDFISKRFKCPNISLATVKTELTSGSKSAADYCKWLAQNCAGADNCSDENKKNCVRHIIQTSDKIEYDECIIYAADKDITSSAPGIYTQDTISNNVDCSSYGFVGMTKSGLDSSCTCDASHPVKALNNSRICCAQSASNKYSYYYNESSPCVYCDYNAFNENTGNCCPSNSYFSKALNKCVCNDGYAPDNASNPSSCTSTNAQCSEGSHSSNGVCVSNPPIISAERFCKLVAYNWNVSSANCSTFKKVDDTNYNQDLYKAITAKKTPYLSSKAVEGAFKNIEPNLIFANGLRMWILGDKSASVAGLSYTPDGYTPSVNSCIETSATTPETCTSGVSYFCKNDNHCYRINAGSNELKLADARNCCSSADFSDLITQFAGNDYLKDPRTYAINGFTVFIDINGSKDDDEGGGTMWKDVFPFYISSNGAAYPGYPLNAAKAEEIDASTGAVIKNRTYDSSSLFQGGNSSALSTDVYYYDIVNNKRRRVNAFSSIPYARALCLSTNISAYTPYCQNLGSKFRNSQTPIDRYIYSDKNPCWKHRCFVKLKNKIKFL